MAQHPTEETLNITRKFLGGELGTPGQAPGLPSQAAPVAGQRAFGQQGARKKPGGGGLVTQQPPRDLGQPLSERFFDLPGPVGFASTPQGQAILQRILGLRGQR